MKQIFKKVLAIFTLLSILFLCFGINTNVNAEEEYTLTINGYNTQADNNGLFLYKNGTTIGSSYYWYKVAIKVNDGKYVVSSIAKSGETTPTDYDYMLLAYSSDTSGAYSTITNLGIGENYIVTFSSDITALTQGTVSVGVDFSKPEGYDVFINGYNTQSKTSLAANEGLFLYKNGTTIGSSLYWYKVAIKVNDGKYVVSSIAKSKEATPTDYDYLLLSNTGEAHTIFTGLNIEVNDIVTFSCDITKLTVGTVSVGVKITSYKDLFDMQTKASLAVNYTTIVEEEVSKITISENGLAMRFGIVIEEALYDAVIANNFKFGVMAYKADNDEFDKTKVTKYVSCTPVKSDANGQASESGKYYTFALVITDIPEANKGNKVAASVCLYSGDEISSTTVVGNALGCVWSVQSMASEYLAKGMESSHEGVLKVLKGE